MLGEGFIRVFYYKEERKFASKLKGAQSHSVDPVSPGLDPTPGSQRQSNMAERGLNQEEQVPRKEVVGRLIPGCPPMLTPDPGLDDCLGDCSFLQHYPDLHVADSGPIPLNPARSTIPQPLISHTEVPALQEPDPDQGYLVMGGSVNVSMNVPGLEPMSNSVLNGMLEKQLEEVYLQHLTENLARCNSHFGNSLLHGLVPPPQPNRQGLDSLEVSLEESTSSDKPISYLHTHNVVPCSSNFSSPMLRISETEEMQ